MDKPMPININGYNTYFVEVQDKAGNYLLIHIPPNANKNIAHICGSLINGHLIQQVDYEKVDGKIAFIKAYY